MKKTIKAIQRLKVIHNYTHGNFEDVTLQLWQFDKTSCDRHQINITATRKVNEDDSRGDWYSCKIDRVQYEFENYEQNYIFANEFFKDVKKYVEKTEKLGAKFLSYYDAILSYLKSKKINVVFEGKYTTFDDFYQSINAQ
jgi:hypothetical protein